MSEIFNLTYEEKIIFRLRALYESYGYRRYKMDKFEEYDFYAKNKDFLPDEGMITFTDTGGKLMALKPDVTLSVVRNAAGMKGGLKKIHYNENVYRISGDTRHYREIMQSGIECIGEITKAQISEAVCLAAKSLLEITPDSVLDVADMGVIGAVPGFSSLDASAAEAAVACFASKNPHGLSDIRMPSETADVLSKLIKLRCKADDAETEFEKMTDDAGFARAAERFVRIMKTLPDDAKKTVRADFSAVGGTKYYSGVTMKGYVKGIPGCVLSGGSYDGLMKRFDPDLGAIGFAVYLDRLERFGGSEAYDV